MESKCFIVQYSLPFAYTCSQYRKALGTDVASLEPSSRVTTGDSNPSTQAHISHLSLRPFPFLASLLDLSPGFSPFSWTQVPISHRPRQHLLPLFLSFPSTTLSLVLTLLLDPSPQVRLFPRRPERKHNKQWAGCRRVVVGEGLEFREMEEA